MKQNSSTPRISIVTPSFNQGKYIEKTIKSVIGQGYPNLEYIVIDGASNDNSTDIIRKYEKQLQYWCSESDEGQYDAINKGFARSSGDIMAWLNADDMYLPWTFKIVSEIFSMFPEVSWITSLLPAHWNNEDALVFVETKKGFNRSQFYRGHYIGHPRHYNSGFIQQEATFWRRSLWEKAGGKIAAEYKLAGDFELWARFYKQADLYGVQCVLAGFRVHRDQRSLTFKNEYVAEADTILQRYGGRHYGYIGSWIRRKGLHTLWPLRVMPSFGFIYSTYNLRWDRNENKWVMRNEWIG